MKTAIYILLFAFNCYSEDLVDKIQNGSILTKEEQAYIDEAWKEMDAQIEENYRDYLQWQANQSKQKLAPNAE